MLIRFNMQPDRDSVLVDASLRPTGTVQGNHPRIDALRVQIKENNRYEIHLLQYASGSCAYLRRIMQGWFVLQVLHYTLERDDLAAEEYPINRPYLLDSAPCKDIFSGSSTGLHTSSSQGIKAKYHAPAMAWLFLIFLFPAAF